MAPRTPMTIITGPLGSGKTTLLRHLLETAGRKLAIIMNEFGEIAIDSKIIAGKNVQIAELAGGCVCCSLTGEFEAAVQELTQAVAPDHIVVEATGVAEPGALVFDVVQNLPQIRLDGVVAIMDADAGVAFPALGHTTRLQIESADLLLLNKIDLVSEPERADVENRLRGINDSAPIVRTVRCRLPVDLVLGLSRSREAPRPASVHEIGFESFGYRSGALFDRAAFEQFAAALGPEVFRAKGFVRFTEGTFLFNLVHGRWELEPVEPRGTELVFIGPTLARQQKPILDRLKTCER